MDRTYIVANFVQTLDGKIAGPGPEYWPIGSPADLGALLDLRAQCDVLIHGRQTALGFAHLDRLSSDDFQARWTESGHDKVYTYMVLSAHPDKLLLDHVAPKGRGVRVVLVTVEGADVPSALPSGLSVWRCGDGEVDLAKLRVMMYEHGFKRCALEAGPRLFGAFVQAKLVDELFLTVAPKLFGTSFGTPTMINGFVFKADAVPQLELVSSKVAGDELFLRYRFKEVTS